MKYNKFSRRMFLQGSGALLSIPLLESLAPSEARAQAAEPIKRYLYYNVGFDLGHQRNWNPKLTTCANQIDIPGSPHKGSFERLASIRASKSQLSPIFTNSFDPFIEKMMFYKGLDVVSHGFHQNAAHYALGSMWAVGDGSLEVVNNPVPGKNPATETFDRVLAKNAKWDAAKRNAICLRGMQPWEKDALGNVVARYAIAGNAYEAYRIIFNNGTYPESGAAPITHSRRDLLSRVMEDYNRVINGRRIGTSDKIILTSALDSIADLQRGLTTEVSNSCRHRDQDSRAEYNKGDFALDDTLNWANYIKLITAIFQCDMSRVITLASNPHDFEDWTSLPVKDYHANITHAEHAVYNGKENWQHVGDLHGRHFKSFVAPLLTALDSCIDSSNNKSFLHNGLVHLTAESHFSHRQVNLPTVTVGSLNGTLPTGYMVNYSDPTRPLTFGGGVTGGSGWSDDPTTASDPMTDGHSYDYPGIPYQRFLVTLAQAMGLAPSDYEDPNLNQHVMNRNDSMYGAENNGITNMGGFGICSFEKLEGISAGADPNSDPWYHHKGRMKRYNWHYYKYPIPQPPKV